MQTQRTVHQYRPGASAEDVRAGRAKLKQWDSGEGVRLLQQRLNASRPKDQQIKVDGLWGPETQGAFTQFRQQHQLQGQEADADAFNKLDGAAQASPLLRSPELTPQSRPSVGPRGPPTRAPAPPVSLPPTTPPVDAAARPSPSTTPQPGDVTLDQLRRSMPGLSAERAQQMLPHLNAAMREANINTPARKAAFLAQLGHESGSLRYMEEIASGRAYEGRRDLGNTQPGDGVRFKGRGPIQITGRANYAAASRDLGIDLVNNPQLAATPEVGFRLAAWYWNKHDLNRYADSGNFDTITKRINGGYNGKADRDRRYRLAQQALR